MEKTRSPRNRIDEEETEWGRGRHQERLARGRKPALGRKESEKKSKPREMEKEIRDSVKG